MILPSILIPLGAIFFSPQDGERDSAPIAASSSSPPEKDSPSLSNFIFPSELTEMKEAALFAYIVSFDLPLSPAC